MGDPKVRIIGQMEHPEVWKFGESQSLEALKFGKTQSLEVWRLPMFGNLGIQSLSSRFSRGGSGEGGGRGHSLPLPGFRNSEGVGEPPPSSHPSMGLPGLAPRVSPYKALKGHQRMRQQKIQ